ncbi:MAG: aminotransferase class V-fold PLP-dependent enzyme, partial [Vulcanococcus sp.]
MADPVIYLDHQASTPCTAAVLAAMAPWWSDQCANPSSRLHRSGLRAAAALEQARSRLGSALGVADAAAEPQRLV